MRTYQRVVNVKRLDEWKGELVEHEEVEEDDMFEFYSVRNFYSSYTLSGKRSNDFDVSKYVDFYK